MNNRRYNGYIYVIIYLMLLRIVLNITIGLNAFSLGILFDLVLMMFWVSAIGYFFRRGVGQKIWYVFVVIVSTIFVVGDSIYYDYFGIISSKSSLSGVKFLSQGQTLEYDLSIPLVAYLITPLLITVIYLIVTNKKKDVFKMRDFFILSSVFVVQVGIFLYWGSYEFESRMDYYRSDAYLFETMHDRKGFSRKYGYYNYHILDIVRFRWEPVYAEEIEEIDNYFESQEEHELNVMSDQFEGYNVVTIIGESLDTRFINEIVTPNLYMMQENGYNFDNYYTPVFQQGATCNSEYMSLTGLMAITTNDWSNNVCDVYNENTFPYALPQQLSDAGYNTYYFHSGYEWFYNREQMIPQYGFENVKFQEDIYALGYTKEEFIDRHDTDMLAFVDEFLKYDEPFYMNLLTYSGHGAYNQEDFDIYLHRIYEAYPGNDFDYEIINYMEKMAELDTMIGLLMDELDEQGELDNTLFVVYPDHFPYMMDSDTYTEHIGIELDDYELKRQNLIMYNSSMTPTTFHTTGSTVDIAPTILNMVHSDGEFKYFMGNDLFGNQDGFVIFSDLTITDGKSYLHLNQDITGDTIDIIAFETCLERKIAMLEVQKKILNTDYFKEE